MFEYLHKHFEVLHNNMFGFHYQYRGNWIKIFVDDNSYYKYIILNILTYDSFYVINIANDDYFSFSIKRTSDEKYIDDNLVEDDVKKIIGIIRKYLIDNERSWTKEFVSKYIEKKTIVEEKTSIYPTKNNLNIFSNIRTLNRKIISEVYICNHCGKTFNDYNEAVNHIMNVKNNLPHDGYNKNVLILKEV